MIVPVAAVADTVTTSPLSAKIAANALDAPENVCVAVNVVAVAGAT